MDSSPVWQPCVDVSLRMGTSWGMMIRPAGGVAVAVARVRPLGGSRLVGVVGSAAGARWRLGGILPSSGMTLKPKEEEEKNSDLMALDCLGRMSS